MTVRVRSVDELAPLFPALLDAMAVLDVGVVLLVDAGGGLEKWYANETAAALHGRTVAEYMELPALDAVPPPEREVAVQLLTRQRSGEPPPPLLEITVLHKDGSPVRLELTIRNLRLDGLLGYVVLMRPAYSGLTSHLSLHEADRIELVGALAAGFAHEINNPLTSVLLNLRSLRKQLGQLPDAARPQATRYLDDITSGAERIASNVRALQTLATRSETKRIDLATIVSSALRLVAPTLEPRANVIRQIFPVRAVIGEEARIGQAVIAMMLFASSGFESAGTTAANRIVVAVEDRDSSVVVEVTDNGRALTSEETQRAFDPSFRGSLRGASAGLGLGVARSVAAALGGDVALAARPGGGAIVTMRLPASD